MASYGFRRFLFVRNNLLEYKSFWKSKVGLRKWEDPCKTTPHTVICFTSFWPYQLPLNHPSLWSTQFEIIIIFFTFHFDFINRTPHNGLVWMTVNQDSTGLWSPDEFLDMKQLSKNFFLSGENNCGIKLEKKKTPSRAVESPALKFKKQVAVILAQGTWSEQKQSSQMFPLTLCSGRWVTRGS